ncbi:unnamed protein product [Closterium sp. Naga37s-1]|nr:unnamed protein product [Closterium sp. Naga37s-1]
MFANERGASPGSGYIRLHGMHLQRPSWEAELQPLEGVTGVVEVVVFDMSVRHRIGYRWRNSSSTDTTPFAHADNGEEEGSGPLFFCCTKELEPLTGCTVGRLIVRREAHEPDWPRVLEAQFMGNSSLTAELSETVHVPRAGFVYVWLAMCDKNLDNTKVFGHTEWWAHGKCLSSLTSPPSSRLPLVPFLCLLQHPSPVPPSHPPPMSSFSASLVSHAPSPPPLCPPLSHLAPPVRPSMALPHRQLPRPHTTPSPAPPFSQLYALLCLAWRPQFGSAWHSLDRNSLPHFLTLLLLTLPSHCPVPPLFPPSPLTPPSSKPASILPGGPSSAQPGTPSLSKHDTPCLHIHPPPPFPPPIPSQLSTLLYFAWRPQFGPAWHSLDRNSLAHFLTFLLLLSLLSSLTTLCDLLLLCTTGHRFVIVTLAAVTVGVLQGLLLRGVLVGVAVGVGTLLPKVGVIPGKVDHTSLTPLILIFPCQALIPAALYALIPAALYVLVAGTCEGMRNVGQVDDWGSGELVALHSPLVLMDLCLAAWLVPTARATEAQVRRGNLLGHEDMWLGHEDMWLGHEDMWLGQRIARGSAHASCAHGPLSCCVARPDRSCYQGAGEELQYGWNMGTCDCYHCVWAAAAAATKEQVGDGNVALHSALVLVDLLLAAWLIPAAYATIQGAAGKKLQCGWAGQDKRMCG